MRDLARAFETTVKASVQVQPVDAALVEAGRKIAAQLDEAERMEGQDRTKALYLTPHLVNILREMLATPAARQAAGLTGKESQGGKLAQLRAVQAKRTG